MTSLASFADRAFSTGLSLQGTPRYRKLELGALIEYGVTDQLTLIALPTLQDIDVAAPTNARRGGMGYSDFGARYRFLEGNGWVASGQATVRVAGTNDISNPAAIGYTDTEIDLRALFGVNFALRNFPAFLDIEVAQRARLGAAPDEFRADATLGIHATQRVMLLVQSFNVISEGSGAPPFASYSYHKLQLSAVYALTSKLSVQFGGYVTYAGHNALQENALLLAAWYRF